jgi:hypothetical protein
VVHHEKGPILIDFSHATDGHQCPGALDCEELQYAYNQVLQANPSKISQRRLAHFIHVINDGMVMSQWRFIAIVACILMGLLAWCDLIWLL